jgi:uncharacterized low-complexity protein
MATVQQSSKPASRFEGFVRQEISRAVRRVRFLDVARAALGLFIGVLAYGLAMMLLDKWLVLSQSVRQVSLFAFLGGVGLYSWFVLLRPIRRAINPYYAAIQVEQMIPDAKNSLVNWLDLHEGNLPPSVTDAIGRRAAEDLQEADLEQAIHSKSLIWLAGVTIGMLFGVVALFIMLRSDQFGSLVDRTFSPFSNQGIVKQTRISIVDPPEGNATVSVNRSKLTITVQVDGRVPQEGKPDSIRLMMRYNPEDPNYTERSLARSTSDPTQWSITLQPNDVQNGFWYQVAGGDDQTPEYHVAVRSSPMVTQFNVTREYRAYMRFEPRHTQDPNIEDWRGTTITLDAFTNRHVKEGWLHLTVDGPRGPQTNSIPATLLPNQPETMRFKFILDQDAKYTISFVADNGETSNNPLPYTIKVLQDMKPTVVFTKPEQLKLAEPESDLMIAADGMLQLEGLATDDFGIRKMTLRMKLDGQELKAQPYLAPKAFELDTGGLMRSVEYKDNVDFTKLATSSGIAIKPETGQKFEYWLEAEDACDYPPPGPQVGSTRHYFVKIISPKVGKNLEGEDKQNKQDELKKERDQAKAEKDQHDQKHEQDRQKQSEEDQKRQEDQKRENQRQNKSKQDQSKQGQDGSKSGESANKDQANPSGSNETSKNGSDPNNQPNQTKDSSEDQKQKDLKALQEELKKEQEGNSSQQTPPQGGNPNEPQPMQDPMKSGSKTDGPMPGGTGQGQPKAGEPKTGEPKAGEPKAGEPKAGEPKAGEPKAGEPKAGEPKAGEPKAGEPKTGEPKASEPKAGEPKTGEPKAGEPKAGQPKAGEPKAGEPKTGEPKAGEPKAGEPKAGEPKAGEPKAGQPKAGEPKAGEPKTGEPKAGEPKAGEPKAGQPKAGEPKTGEPKAGEPKAGQPKAGEPKAGEPKTGEPKAGEPKAGEPKAGEPKAGEPKAGEPKAGEPKAGEPKAGQPKAGEPNAGEPKTGEPKAGEPKAGEPKAGQPKAGEPKAGEPKADEPKTGEPKAGEPKAGEPKAGEPKAGEPKAGEPKTGEPKAGEPKAGEPKAGEPKAGQPKAGEPKAGEPKTGEPKAGEPKAGQPKAGEPKAGEPKAGEPKAGEPKAGEPKTGEPKAGEPKAGEPKAGQPKAGEPKAGEPKTGEPKAGEPKAGQPKAGEPKAGEPKAGEPKAGEPRAGEPKSDGTKSDGSNSQKPKDEKGPAGSNPGAGSDTAPGDRRGASTPEDLGKIEKPNEDFKKKAGDLDLTKIDKEKLKKLFEKYKITPEEWDRYVKDLAKQKNDRKDNSGKNDLQTGSHLDGSVLNKGTKRVEGKADANPGQLQSGSTGQAPPEYRQAAEKFAELLSKPQPPKQK